MVGLPTSSAPTPSPPPSLFNLVPVDPQCHSIKGEGERGEEMGEEKKEGRMLLMGGSPQDEEGRKDLEKKWKIFSSSLRELVSKPEESQDGDFYYCTT